MPQKEGAVSDVGDVLAKLTPEQRARLTQRLAERRRAGAADDQIRPRPDRLGHPLSPAQERIWVLARLRPDSAVYNLQEAKRLVGPLDVAALRHSFTQVLRRHETLRATFVDDDGQPRQRIADAGDIDLEVADLSGDPDPLEHARDLARRDAERPFDLTSGPLLRVTLLRLGADDHVLLTTAHHIVCDGWSMGVIERELSALYQAAVTGASPPLPEPDLQYADVAHWLHQRAGDGQDRRLDYWAHQLSGDVHRLELPGDGDRTGPRTAGGAHHDIALPAPLTAAVHEVSRRSKVTPFITLMAAFQVTLHRYTRQEDLIVCTPTAGRSRSETQHMVGYFNNLVAIRGDMSGDPSFDELLERMRPVVAGAFDHQDVAFQAVATLPSVATTPLTRALFVLQDADMHTLSLPGITVSTLTIEAATADFELGVFMRPEGDRLVGTVRYRTDQFDGATLTTLLGNFERTLELVLATPSVRLAELPPIAAPHVHPTTAPAHSGQLTARPRTALESQLCEIWERLFSLQPISIHDDFFELGGHSLLAAELAAEVERRITGEPLPLASLFSAPTIADLAEMIDTGGWSHSWSSLVPLKPSGARPPLFFVHAHGGNVIGYHELARSLGPDQPLYGLQAPDTQSADGPIRERRIPDMAAAYIREIRDVQPHGPYFLGGWCLGADVAYEMAIQLTADGEDVPLVIMVDNPRPSYSRTSTTGSMYRRLMNRVRSRVEMEWDNLRLAAPADRWSYARTRTAQLAGAVLVRAEARVSAAAAALSVPLPASRALRRERIAAAHQKAYAQYDPPAYGGRVALFRAALQPAGRAPDPSLGWAPHVTGTFDIYEIPGHRIGLLSAPRVNGVAERMVRAMDMALAAGQR